MALNILVVDSESERARSLAETLAEAGFNDVVRAAAGVLRLPRCDPHCTYASRYVSR